MDSYNRVGKIQAIPSSIVMVGSLRGPIALCEVQAYVYAAKNGIANVAADLGDANSRIGFAPRPSSSDRISNPCSGQTRWACLRWLSMAKRSNVACAAPMPDSVFFPELRLRINTIPRSRRFFLPHSSPGGEFEPSLPASVDTTRCLTTMVRCGLMTMH